MSASEAEFSVGTQDIVFISGLQIPLLAHDLNQIGVFICSTEYLLDT